jgi:hypothetical protein
MRVVLKQKRVVGHVMRYPGEVVELPDDPANPAAAGATVDRAFAQEPDEDGAALETDVRPATTAEAFFAQKPRPRGRSKHASEVTQ